MTPWIIGAPPTSHRSNHQLEEFNGSIGSLEGSIGYQRSLHCSIAVPEHYCSTKLRERCAMALEPIDCTSHSREIEQSYLKVVRGDDADTTWLIISPNGQKEYTPAFVGSDFTEFLESFDDAKVQFGLARVSPPGSDVEKLILIGWCPDSAPMKTRASFAANFGTVANQVLKGYHVQVTARDEDDLDEKELLQKISNAAGARYSIQVGGDKPKPVRQPKVSTPPPVKETPKPAVQTQSKPSAPTPAKQTPVRRNDAETDDWNEPEVEERDFDQNPLKSNQSTYKPIGKVDLKKVIAEENAREDPRLVSATDASSKIAPEADIARLKQESKLKRDSEINKFLGTKPPINASPASKNDDKVIKGFKNEKSPAQLWAEKKAAASASSEPKAEPVQSEPVKAAEEQEPVEEEEENVHDLKSKFEKLGASSNEPPIISPRPAASTPSAPAEEKSEPVKIDSRKFGNPLPGMHTEIPREDENEEESDGSWDDEEPAAPSLPSRNAAPQAAKTEEEKPAPLPPKAEEPEEESEPEQEEPAEEEAPAPALPSRGSGAPAPPPPARRSVEPAKPASPSATAEYDYEAAEDNELTFSENDKIINIEFVDEDWWLGELEKNGQKGLFPSNYVSLEN